MHARVSADRGQALHVVLGQSRSLTAVFQCFAQPSTHRGVSCCAAKHHVPGRTLLYALVQAYYLDFIAHLEAEDRTLPAYVREEFETSCWSSERLATVRFGSVAVE